MTQSHPARHLCLVFLFFSLSACTAVSIKEPGPGNKLAYTQRADKLIATGEWGLLGKISLDDGDQGGSGTLQWDVKPGFSELDFHGALGRGAWHLQIGPEVALLKMADGTEQIAAGVNDLIQDRVGWPIPLEALQWWVRGLSAPGVIENETLGSDGLLIGLKQFGWRVDFDRYDAFGDVMLPVRMEATQDSYRVKLAIKRWQMGVGDDLKD